MWRPANQDTPAPGGALPPPTNSARSAGLSGDRRGATPRQIAVVQHCVGWLSLHKAHQSPRQAPPPKTVPRLLRANALPEGCQAPKGRESDAGRRRIRLARVPPCGRGLLPAESSPVTRPGGSQGLRGCVRSGHNTVDSAAGITRENSDHFRDKGSQFLQSGTTGNHDGDWNRKVLDVLLICEPLINRDKGVETMIHREPQQLPVRASRPTHLLHRARSKRIGKCRREPPWHGFVQQHPHGASPTSFAVTRSSSSTACALDTVG